MPQRNPPPKVLIVEDSPSTLASLKRLIVQEGFRVDGASTGFQAASLIHSGAEPPDVILVDLMIPETPGEEVIRLVRDMKLTSRRTGLPVRVVAYTGLDEKAEPTRLAIAAGADAVIIKPCDLERTMAVVRGEDPGDVEIPPRNP